MLRYAREICDRGLARSVMEIDDRWQTRYGDIEFDPRKFPDPKAMVDELHALGFKVRGGGGRVQGGQEPRMPLARSISRRAGAERGA